MTSPRPERMQIEALTRSAQHVVRIEDLAAKLAEGRALRVKLGVDPTVGDVTLGWAVPLRKLRQFQDGGHTAVLIMGDFTARIGDPSGKSETRKQLTKEEVSQNAEACVEQLLDILSQDRLEIRYNSEWLEEMDLTGVLRLTSEYTIAQMLERDDFSNRYRQRVPISMIEFMYPLLQGYDSVAVEADVELGGTDQLFNLLVGRNLQKAYGQKPQIALTMPLLIGLDGVQKMSQSLRNYIGIREAPDEIFGKLMSLPDHLIGSYAGLVTGLEHERVAEIETQSADGGPAAGRAKREVASAVVAAFHGGEAAVRAEASFDRQFKEHRAPIDPPTAAIPPDAIDGRTVYLPRVLAELGLATSRSDARRLIAHKGVKVNGEATSLEDHPLDELRDAILQVGKRRFVRLREP